VDEPVPVSDSHFDGAAAVDEHVETAPAHMEAADRAWMPQEEADLAAVLEEEHIVRLREEMSRAKALKAAEAENAAAHKRVEECRKHAEQCRVRAEETSRALEEYRQQLKLEAAAAAEGSAAGTSPKRSANDRCPDDVPLVKPEGAASTSKRGVVDAGLTDEDGRSSKVSKGAASTSATAAMSASAESSSSSSASNSSLAQKLSGNTWMMILRAAPLQDALSLLCVSRMLRQAGCHKGAWTGKAVVVNARLIYPRT
jgi:hypothetical protein